MLTEREKMLAGEIYDSRDSELIGMYHNAKNLLEEFNNAPSTEAEFKFNVLKNLFKFVGDGVWIEKYFSCDYGKNISIGKNTFINYNCVFIDDNFITIGENVLIGPTVQIYTATHPINPLERIKTNSSNGASYTTFTKPVSIGNNSWIGGGAIICPGVTIGDNTVIGAGSVVTKSIPSNCVAYGNPCKVVERI